MFSRLVLLNGKQLQIIVVLYTYVPTSLTNLKFLS